MKCLVKTCAEPALEDSQATGFRSMGLCLEHHDKRTTEVADNGLVKEAVLRVFQARQRLNEMIAKSEDAWDAAHGVPVGRIRFRLEEGTS